MSLWQCKIVSRRNGRVSERSEIIGSDENLTSYIRGDVPSAGDEVSIIIQYEIPPPRNSKSPKKPWWKFW